MKKILILIILLGLLFSGQSFAQNNIKLYPYQMSPSKSRKTKCGTLQKRHV